MCILLFYLANTESLLIPINEFESINALTDIFCTYKYIIWIQLVANKWRRWRKPVLRTYICGRWLSKISMSLIIVQQIPRKSGELIIKLDFLLRVLHFLYYFFIFHATNFRSNAFGFFGRESVGKFLRKDITYTSYKIFGLMAHCS